MNHQILHKVYGKVMLRRIWKRSERSMGKEIVLPKNIRQMGDVHGKEKIYMEDYVMTYIRKKEQQEENGSIGILLGERHETPEGVFVFIRGIYETAQEYAEHTANEEHAGDTEYAENRKYTENIEHTGKAEHIEKTEHTEKTEHIRKKHSENTQEDAETKSEEESSEQPPLTLKERIHKGRIEYFPGWDVEGCCVIGKYRPELLEELFGILPGTQQLIFHLQEQEETVYWRAQGEYRRVHGYFVFYEQNRKMQEYLSDVFGASTVEQEKIPERAIKSFREKIREKSEQKAGSMLKLASSFFVITVLVAGAVAVNRIDEIRKVQNVTNMSSKEPNGQWDLEYTKEQMLALRESEAAAQREAEAQEAAAQYAADLQGDGMQGAADLQGADVQGAADLQGAGIQGVAELQSGDDTDAADAQNRNAQGMETQNADAQQTDEIQGTAELQSGDDAGTADAQTVGMQEMGAQEQGTETQKRSAQEQSAETQEMSAAEASAQDADAAWMAGSDAFWEDEEFDAGAQEEAQEAAVRSAQASYVIKPGDTLANICKQYYGSIEQLAQLCEANNISDANKIMPGQKIVLP